MANTGNLFPATGENVDRAGLTAWTAPTAIVSDNATDATCNGAGSDYLIARSFDFSGIPDGSTINGILVRVEASEHSGGTEPLLAQLQDDTAALIGSSKSTSNEGSISGTTKAVYTYGSTSDVWGATLTTAIVKDADFGVRLWFATSHDVRIDFVTMAIEYTPPTRRGVVTWAELEVPNGPRRAIITWAELEVPTAPRRGVVTWAELEIPTAPRRGVVTWAELEVPNAPRRGVITWAELEIPIAPRRGIVTWAELEIPDAPRRGIVTWAELEIPNAPRRGVVTWAELEIPTAPRRAIITWVELEVPSIPSIPRRAIVTWTEFEIPDVPVTTRRALIGWAEFEIPSIPLTIPTGYLKFVLYKGSRRIGTQVEYFDFDEFEEAVNSGEAWLVTATSSTFPWYQVFGVRMRFAMKLLYENSV